MVQGRLSPLGHTRKPPPTSPPMLTPSLNVDLFEPLPPQAYSSAALPLMGFWGETGKKRMTFPHKFEFHTHPW